jgi:L-aspartate oxidase
VTEPYDIVIVGGGIAGLACALTAPAGARIAVVDKGEARAGSSPLAQGGIAAAVGRDDSVELHATDTIAAGAGLCDDAMVRDICDEGPGVVAWLESLGARFDRAPDGSLDLAREGGQTVARSVHTADATGFEIVRALREAARGRAERIDARATALLVADGLCAGVLTEEGPVLGRGVLLATGGAGALWAATTNAPGATGDGIALAMAAGATLAHLEFMQFHPTALDDGTAGRILLTEALRGAGATLADERGERFVDELAPRHVVAKAIVERGRAYLDCRAVEHLEERFPTVVAGTRARGFDPLVQTLPVSPAAHYFIGGVAVDARARSSISGLYAAGECAATGMHGANRMAGNSLLESVVLGRRAAAMLGEEPAGTAAGPTGGDASSPALTAPDPSIPRLMWDGCGPFRDELRLRGLIDALERLPASLHRELCLGIARSALERRESRGVHQRTDFRDPDPALAVRTVPNDLFSSRDG